MSDQPVYAYLVYPGAVQQGSEGVAAVVRGMVCLNSNSFESPFKQSGICADRYRLPVHGKQYPIIGGEPVFHKFPYFGVDGDGTVFPGSGL